MLKYLLLLALCLIVWWSWRAPRRSANTTATQSEEHMVACARCGVYLPASEALPGPGGTHFCSPQHRDG